MMKSRQRTREFKGPTPHSVGLLAKPPYVQRPDHVIIEHMKAESLRNEALAIIKANKQSEFQSSWQKESTKKMTQGMVKREMQWHLQQERVRLEERRDKLRELLLRDEEQYLREMELQQETIEERQIKMKQRASFLKEKREAERQAFAEEKLEQKFRNECEELRSTLSKRHRDEIFKERQEQLAMKEQMKQQEQHIDKIYDELWAQDFETKAKREELEAVQQMQRNKDMLEVLNLQKAALVEQKKEKERMKELEYQWLKEEEERRKYEEECLTDLKRQKHAAARRARDVSIKLKKRKEAKEKQEELALDMKILEQILKDTRNEEVEDKNKKANMRLETQRFMHYLDMNKKEEKERELELEKLVNVEVQKQWDKKDRQRQLEREARSTLMRNVLQTREKQKQERDEIVRKEHERAYQERQELLQQMEEHKRLESDRLDSLRRANKRYQQDLEHQIQFQRMQKDREIEEARKELELMQDAERKYQRRLKSALESPDTRRQHPLRISGLGYNSRATSC